MLCYKEGYISFLYSTTSRHYDYLPSQDSYCTISFLL